MLALLDESGDIAESYRCDGFGRITVFDGTGAEHAASALGDPFGFACKRYDPTTALCNFGARWYDPALGRFLSPDPLGFVDGPNRYAYCVGDPVNFVDPWGLCGEKGYYRVEAPVVGPFGNYYPNRPTWYSRPLADVFNALANLLNLGLLPTEPWRRFDRYAYETWDWYERSTDWLESDQALFAYLAFPEAGAGMAWRNAGYLAESVSALARAGWARWLPSAGGVAPGSGAKPSFYVTPDGQAIAATGYRAVGGPAVDEALTGTISPRPSPGTYVTFDDITQMPQAQLRMSCSYPEPQRMQFISIHFRSWMI